MDIEEWIVCRVCLQQPLRGLEPIFYNNKEKDLTQMILECGGVPIHKCDPYPDKICDKCLKYLKVAHKFRTTCQRSHQHLSKLIVPETDDTDEQLLVIAEDEYDDELVIKSESKEEKRDYCKAEDLIAVFNALEDDDRDFMERDNSNQTNEFEYEDDIGDEDYVLDTKTSPRKNVKPKVIGSAKKRSDFVKKKKTPKSRKPPSLTAETSFICEICANIYPTQGRLNDHMKLHNGIKPFECEICHKTFAKTPQLSRHMNTHTGLRPFKCKFCPASFADPSTCIKHHRIHTNERPYICDECGKAFPYSNVLKVHMMTHTGEKPFSCDYCAKKFAKLYHKRMHERTHISKME